MTYIYKRELIRIDLCPQILTVLNESLIYMLNPTHVQSHIVGDPQIDRSYGQTSYTRHAHDIIAHIGITKSKTFQPFLVMLRNLASVNKAETKTTSAPLLEDRP